MPHEPQQRQREGLPHPLGAALPAHRHFRSDFISHFNEWPRYLQGNNLMCHPVLNCSGEDRLLPGGVNDLPAAAQEKCFFR